jgi:hypothetical protein
MIVQGHRIKRQPSWLRTSDSVMQVPTKFSANASDASVTCSGHAALNPSGHYCLAQNNDRGQTHVRKRYKHRSMDSIVALGNTRAVRILQDLAGGNDGSPIDLGGS